MRKNVIRISFLLILQIIILLAVAQTAGYLVATGTIVAASILVWTMLSRRYGAFIYLRTSISIASVVVLWFLAVDRSLFVSDCPGCLRRQYDYQYRILAVSISSQIIDEPNVVQLALSDLGVPCEHEDLVTWHKHRFWGLKYCGYPCVNALGLAHEPYSEQFASKIRKLGVENPNLCTQLRDLAVREHDYKMFWQRLKHVTETDDIYQD